MSAELPASAAPRPNPFAFVTDSSFRFGLLIVAVLGSALYLTSPWGYALQPQARVAADAALACLAPATQSGTRAPISGLGDVLDRLREPGRRTTGAPCSNAVLSQLSSSRGLALVVIGFALAIVLAALGVYWLTPAWLIWRRRLVPISVAQIPELESSLAGLCDEAGVGGVTFLVDPVDARRTGLAFGRPGRRFVVLGRGLLHSFRHDHDLYRTVVLHELAHICNRDIDSTFLTVAIWRAFVVIVVAPLTLSIALRLALLPGGLPARATDLQVAWRLVVLGVLVLMIRNAILRSRELYADIKAAQWGAGDTLRRLFALGAGGSPSPPSRARRLISRALAAFHTHPEPAVRGTAVAGAIPLDAGLWDGALLGVVATFATSSIELTAGWLEGGLRYGLERIAPGVLAVPLAVACCIVVSRVVLAGQVTGTRFGLDRFAVGLGGGLVAGEVLGPSAASLPPGVLLRGQPTPEPGSWVVWIALTVVLSVLFIRWLEVVTRTWMPRIRGRVSPNWLPALVGGVAALVLGFCLPPLLVFPDLVVLGHQLVLPELPEIGVAAAVTVLLPSFGVFLLPAGQPIELLALLIGLWMVPVAGWLLTRGDAAALPGWASLDPIPSGRHFSVAALRPLWAVRVGIRSAVVVVLALAAFYGLLFLWTRGTRPLALLAVALPLGLPMLASVLSAARAAAMAVELRSLHGLIAASAAAGVTLVGSHAALALSACILLGACGLPASPLAFDLSSEAFDLAYSILIGGLVAWPVGSLSERRRRRGGVSAPRGGAGRWVRLGRRLTVVLAGVVLLLLVESAAVVKLRQAWIVVVPLLLLAAGAAVGLRWGRRGLVTAIVVATGESGTLVLLGVPAALAAVVLLTHLVAILLGYGVGRVILRVLSPR